MWREYPYPFSALEDVIRHTLDVLLSTKRNVNSFQLLSTNRCLQGRKEQTTRNERDSRERRGQKSSLLLMIISFGPDHSFPEEVCNRRSEDRALHYFASANGLNHRKGDIGHQLAHIMEEPVAKSDPGRIPKAKGRGHWGLHACAWNRMGGACTHAMKRGGCEKGKERRLTVVIAVLKDVRNSCVVPGDDLRRS